MSMFATRLTTASSLIFLAGTASAQTGRYVDDLAKPTITAGDVSAKMDLQPYSSSYLPRYEGPLARERDTEIERMLRRGYGDCDLVHQVIKDNAAKPTSEKFDVAMTASEGRNPGLTENYNRTGYDKKAKRWEGFCHNWAPAGIDPASAFVVELDKIYADVPFGIGDLRELTTWFYPRPYSEFYGARNYGRESASDNLDPVDLLTLLETYVGPDKPGIVFDVDPGVEVWNQAIYSWKRTATELTGRSRGRLPGGATKAFEVDLNLEYVAESHYAARGETNLVPLSWKMKVYTDDEGNIVKAKWGKPRGDKIPDFAWAPTGKNDSADFRRLKKIAKDGVSVKEIEKFCRSMQALTAASFNAGEGRRIAETLTAICPVLDQNKLSDYIRRTAERTGIDFSVLESTLREEPAGGNG